MYGEIRPDRLHDSASAEPGLSGTCSFYGPRRWLKDVLGIPPSPRLDLLTCI